MNNAGYGLIGEAEGVDERSARTLIEVLFWGAAHVTKQVRSRTKPSAEADILGRQSSSSVRSTQRDTAAEYSKSAPWEASSHSH